MEGKTTQDNHDNEMVIVHKSPISERYCNVGDIVWLDRKNNKIRCGGAWFDFDDRWYVEPHKS